MINNSLGTILKFCCDSIQQPPLAHMQRVRGAELLTALLIRQLDPTAFPDSLQEFGPLGATKKGCWLDLPPIMAVLAYGGCWGQKNVGAGGGKLGLDWCGPPAN